MDPRPIGVFDSGVGGLTVARALMDYLPSAARAAGGHPSLVIWHFQLPSPES